MSIFINEQVVELVIITHLFLSDPMLINQLSTKHIL